MRKKVEKKSCGAPCKLNDEVTKKLINALNLGATYTLACNYAGISFDTFRKWMRHGLEEETGKYRTFYDIVKKAQGDAAVMWLAKIEKAASKSWQAAAWKLERRYPKDYGRSIKENLIETNHVKNVSILSDEELQKIVDEPYSID